MPRIYKFQPFSVEKQLGEEYNAHCELVPNDDDWILILDYDCMILTPETYQVIEAAIMKYPKTVMFGAMTNRVGLSFQRLNKEMNEDDSIRNHLKIAKEQAELHKDGFCIDAAYIGGFFMLFRKSYWMKNKFQEKIIDRRGNFFDYTFCRPLRQYPGAIKVIKGAYVFHKYRIDQTNYRIKEHLK